MFDRIGESHGFHIVGVGGFKGLDIGVAVARCLDQVFARFGREPGVDEVIGQGGIGLSGIEQVLRRR